jgi:hypothetical protein
VVVPLPVPASVVPVVVVAVPVSIALARVEQGDRHGQGPSPLSQEIHRFPAGEAIEKAITEDADAAAQVLDAVPAEGLFDQAAQAAVVRVVVREHVVGEHPQEAR